METSKEQRVIQECNKQFYETLNSDQRFIIHRGGSRSGKSVAICQYIAYVLLTAKDPQVITIIRKTLPTLKGSIYRDMIKILEDTEIYYHGIHNKSENTFRYKNHLLEFRGLDDPQKLRGAFRTICYANEINELTKEDFTQLNMRTKDKFICDYNPSDPNSWIYDDLESRDDADVFVSTYMDNAFLDPLIKAEIERLEKTNPNYWQIYGLGQRATYTDRQIFTDFKIIDHNEFPDLDETYLGLDFGYTNDPTAIVEVGKQSNKLYVHEILYKTKFTNQMIIDYIKRNDLDQKLIYAESAEPKSIDFLSTELWVKPATKGAGSIMAGIMLLKDHEIIVSKQSKNMIKEFYNYWWEKTKNGQIINVPRDKHNHCMDALRYMVFSRWKKGDNFFVI
tara:strand:- start:1584 stop:2762 length:1179 start_codon:yes stop_codon:yes gene_type:complete